ncbi:MAG: clan AA aspartic protease [Chloroflexi bacterium]|nr:clan AA aspartic protease [Chloroflexota bacterium]
MGTFTIPLHVSGPSGARFVEVEALVDTGASHTLLPRDVLVELGIAVVERVPFQLADERTVEYEVGEARLRLDGRERTALVVFGPPGAMPLLGATTLELFNMGVDPVRRCLVPVPGLLK